MKASAEDREGATISDDQISADIVSKLKEVDTKLLKKMKREALSIALRNPPAGSKSESVKVTDGQLRIDSDLIRHNIWSSQ